MKKIICAAAGFLSLFLFGCTRQMPDNDASFSSINESRETVDLPAPQLSGNVSLEEALLKRRSNRSYSSQPLSLEEISQLLWAGQGITAPDSGGRTAPSAGALYPLELFLVVLNGTDPQPGLYRYLPPEHSLQVLDIGDFRDEIHALAFEQGTADQAPAVLFLSADPGRLEERYGGRALTYAVIEAGHAAQNIVLQATALGLNTVTIGAIDYDTGRELFGLGEEEFPVYLLPVGHPPAEAGSD